MASMLRTIGLVAVAWVAVFSSRFVTIAVGFQDDEFAREVEAAPEVEAAREVEAEERWIELEADDEDRELRAESPEDGSEPARERISRRLEELKARMQQALRAGQFEEIERLGREARELFQQLAPDERAATLGPDVEFHRRNWHVQAAIEHLRAAGWDEQADQLTRRAERLLWDRGTTPEWDPYGGVSPRPAAQTDRVERLMRRLQGQVDELRRQLDEIRPLDPRAANDELLESP